MSNIRTFGPLVYLQVTLADLHVLARLIPTLEVVFKNSMNRSKRKEKIAIKKPATKFLDYEVLQNILHGGSSLELDVSSNEIMTTKKLAAETVDYDVLQNMLHGGSSSELDISSDEIMTTKKPASETADYDVLQNILHGGSSSELDVRQGMIHDVDSEKKKKKKKSSVKVKSTASEASNDRKIESENPEKHMPEANTLQHVRDGEMIEETCTLGDKSDSDKKKKKKKKSQSVKVESTALEASNDRKIESENPEKHMLEANTLQHVRDSEMIDETCTLGDKSDSDKKKKKKKKSQSVKVESTALEASDDRKIESENPEKHMPEANTLQHVRDGEMIKETCTLGDKSDSDKKKKKKKKKPSVGDKIDSKTNALSPDIGTESETM